MKLYVPPEIHNKLIRLTHQPLEVVGALIYWGYNPFRDYANDMFVSAFWRTGRGLTDEVDSDPARINALLTFMQQNPQYDYSIAHMHTDKTIRKHGEYYATHFSAGDLETIKQNKEKQVSHWWEVLYTPEAVIFSEPGIELVVADWIGDDLEPCADTHQEIKGELHRLLAKRI